MVCSAHLVLSHQNNLYLPLGRRTKRYIKWLRALQLVFRIFESSGALGALALLLLITNVDEAAGWVMRVSVSNMAERVVELFRRSLGLGIMADSLDSRPSQQPMVFTLYIIFHAEHLAVRRARQLLIMHSLRFLTWQYLVSILSAPSTYIRAQQAGRADLPTKLLCCTLCPQRITSPLQRVACISFLCRYQCGLALSFEESAYYRQT